MSSKLTIDAGQLVDSIERLAQFSDAPPPAITRVMLSDADMAAREFLLDAFQEAGLETRADAAGNLFARWQGTQAEWPAVATGSHTDAIPYSGKYDGTVGVLGALAAVRGLQAAGYQPQRSIDIVMFTSEEPTRYGIGCLGSRLLAGVLDPQAADALQDERDESFASLRAARGYQGDLASVRLSADAYSAFVELHIEQGPILEQQQVDIGVVTHIAAPATLRVIFEGQGGHAGAVLMNDRRDALLPAARLALAVDAAARQLGGPDTVATTGRFEVHPGAVNSIPSRTRLEIDIREIDVVRRDLVLAHIEQKAHSLGEEHHQRTTVEVINADPPTACDPRVVEAVTDACQASGHTHQPMISRAYHDALFMAQVCPTGMIFIPCRDGVSHRPEEYAAPEAMAAGAVVLAETLRRLADTPEPGT